MMLIDRACPPLLFALCAPLLACGDQAAAHHRTPFYPEASWDASAAANGDSDPSAADGSAAPPGGEPDGDDHDGEAAATGNDAAPRETTDGGGDGEVEPGVPDAGTPEAPGDGGVVRQTIVVGPGETFDGKGMRYTAGSELGDGSQGEGQKPVFRLEHGAKLVNVVLGAPAADGIHTHGDVKLENIVWEDIGEDALTIKESGTVILDGGSATNGADKVFQINAASTFRVSNFTASHAGKFVRQNGGSDFDVAVIIDHCDISFMDEAIFRTDSDVSSVTMTNSRYSMIGDELFMGVNPANITLANNTAY